MVRVVYVGSDGVEREVEAKVAETLMSAAVRVGIPGIVGECGGNASCATCHVWVRDEFRAAVGEPVDLEDDMLDLGVSCRRAGSRLSCQIVISEGLEGIHVDLPPEQP